MSPAQDSAEPPAREPSSAESQHFARLSADADPPSASELVERLDFSARAPDAPLRPYVILNMVSTVDGRASIAGRSGAIGDRADRVLFHALRASVDGVMAGAGTIRVERYGRIIPSEAARAGRLRRGLSEEPLACIVSGRLSLSPDTPLLAEPAAHVVILTPSAASVTGVAAQVEYVRAERDGRLDLPRALAELSERFGLRTLLCEGGPHLNAELLMAGLVDELFLSLAPKLAGGEAVTGESLRILAGGEFEQPLELELLGVLEHESHLFLRYAVRPKAHTAEHA
ncbi:MAG TPA: dihydrofolate reductase family protein [Solirubrobacteraceae bacterium]|jgi:5-amino-6-(5-phosphoribosylamino)uracil reductase|nr:dihydrofolate reductase family protein [Solirubrobacteraceae bacterium]